MATPDVTVDIADFVTGVVPASKGGYLVSLTEDVAAGSTPNPTLYRQGYTNYSGVATLSAVTPDVYRLQVFGLGVDDRVITVTDDEGPLDAADLTVGDSVSSGVVSANNPLLQGSNITLTQKPTGLEIASSGGGGEGTGFTDTSGALSIESTVVDGASAVAFSFNSENLLSTSGAKLASFGNANTELVNIGPQGGIIIGDAEWVEYWHGANSGRKFTGIVNFDEEVSPTEVGMTLNGFSEIGSIDNIISANVSETRSELVVTGPGSQRTFRVRMDETTLETYMSIGLSFVAQPHIAAGLGGNAYLFGTQTAQTEAASRIASFQSAGVKRFEIANVTTAGNTPLFLYDPDNNTLQRVTLGAADSGGSGFRALRIPNAP
jgi:hypothetical protein